MKSKYLLPPALLTLAASLTILPAHADTVLTNTVGFIKGTQIFTDSFDITTPGVLTVTLSSIPWLDTLQGMSVFLTSPNGGLIGTATPGKMFESMQVKPGEIAVNWYGQADGTFGMGVYGLKVDFEPNGIPVPLPGALPLFLSGLGVLSMWRRTRRSERPAHTDG